MLPVPNKWFPRLVGLRGSTHGKCRPFRQDWAWPVRQDWFLTCVPVGDQTTSDSLTGNCLLSNRMVWPMWVNIVNLQRQMRIKLQNEDDLRNMLMFYSRVGVRVRTVATLCFCTCVSFPGVQVICTAKQLGRAMCVHKCAFTDLICLYMLQLGEGQCVHTAYHITRKDQRQFRVWLKISPCCSVG